jgi:alpha-aminoadipate carrier protein LysW
VRYAQKKVVPRTARLIERPRLSARGVFLCVFGGPFYFMGVLSMSNCPECGGDVPATDVIQGEILPCPDCGAELEVLSTDPVTLELAPQVREDWGE